MTRLSVNINKVALIRNARGGNLPNLIDIARDCEHFGGQGITVHPRPDQRHIRYDDIGPLREIVKTEFNIEGNPTDAFLDLVCAHQPEQCTLVPDAPEALTSDSGWDTLTHRDFLQSVVARLHKHNIRVSLFLDPDPVMVQGALDTGVDRIELYTGEYAKAYQKDPAAAIHPFQEAASLAHKLGLGINAGHDLNLDNLKFFKTHIPQLMEVSIGHALICDALYYGLQNTIQMYLHQLA